MADPQARYSTVGWSHSQAEFRFRLAAWECATAAFSSPSKVASHPTAVALMECPNALQLMIAELNKEASWLVFVLQRKTGVSPYEGTLAGDLEAMRQAWIEWYARQSSVLNVEHA